MRLIDVDALKAMLAEEEITFPMLDDVPKVDAIPVEWMESRKCKPDEAYAIRKMLDEWAERN